MVRLGTQPGLVPHVSQEQLFLLLFLLVTCYSKENLLSCLITLGLERGLETGLLLIKCCSKWSTLNMISALMPAIPLRRALFLLWSCGSNKWPIFHPGELLCSCAVRETHAPRALLSSRKGLLLWPLQESMVRQVWVLPAVSYPPAVHAALVLVPAGPGDQSVRAPQSKLQMMVVELRSTWSGKQDLAV